MDRPTIFLSNFHPFVTKNTLNSGVLDALASQSKVIILVSKEKEEYFKQIYEKENIIVEGINLDPYIKSGKNKIFIRLSELLLDTNVTRFHQMEACVKDGNWFKYYFFRAFTRTLSHFLLFKKLVHVLDFKIDNPKPFQNIFEHYKPLAVFATDAFGDHDVFLLKNSKSAGIT